MHPFGTQILFERSLYFRVLDLEKSCRERAETSCASSLTFPDVSISRPRGSSVKTRKLASAHRVSEAPDSRRFHHLRSRSFSVPRCVQAPHVSCSSSLRRILRLSLLFTPLTVLKNVAQGFGRTSPIPDLSDVRLIAGLASRVLEDSTEARCPSYCILWGGAGYPRGLSQAKST